MKNYVDISIVMTFKLYFHLHVHIFNIFSFPLMNIVFYFAYRVIYDALQ